MSEVTSKQIAEWRALQGEGMISTVGEYTPDEFWIVLDELAVRDARLAEQEAQIKTLQSDANSWQSGYDEGRSMGAKHCMGTIEQLRAELATAKETISRYETTAENCDLLRAELAALREQVPAVLDFVFAGDLPNATFVEVEDSSGKSVSVGEWINRGDGYLVLRISAAPVVSGAVVLPEPYELLRTSLQEIVDCPQRVEPSTVPRDGIEAAPQQVVVNMSVGLMRLRNAREVLDEVARLNPAPATPVEQCTNEDSWNCKYCRKTNGCKALSDPRNFGSPASADVVQVPAVFVRFLLGEADKDGVSFGDTKPGSISRFWWRKELRAILATLTGEPG